jgi:hypothetical protein
LAAEAAVWSLSIVEVEPAEVDDARLADRVDLIPVGAEPLDRLRAVADEATALQLEQRQRADELGLERRSARCASVRE